MVELSATRCSCIAILWVSLVSFFAITLCVASQRVFVFVYFAMTQSEDFWIHPRTSAIVIWYEWLSISFTLRPLNSRGKNPPPHIHWRGGLQSCLDAMKTRKILGIAWSWTQAVQPVSSSHFTDWAIVNVNQDMQELKRERVREKLIGVCYAS
jgi:hypothetical protein